MRSCIEAGWRLPQRISGLTHLGCRPIRHPPRYHVDIETDDLEAEVARLTALGAEPVSQWKEANTWP
ncbi:VOC family protein [Amycolatopsis sp. SID8362]|uniref:VOC family protein n=1 Tax=Amycolatopsis sp. SID8362 TaxID=2690346 RepID=UPI00136BC25E|nr:VOC family protein [Amycolatopsis sp. SID8362]NBH03195.1 hypothetical protein [Amycolatopsis sp. SID8362]NED39896.1 VOC family protein [Amycolatopsis sp. SID8362]